MTDSKPRPSPEEALDTQLDQIIASYFLRPPPRVLYRYTNWEGLEGILQSASIWATAHDCTNEQNELVSADRIVRETAATPSPRSETCGHLFGRLLAHFDDLHVTNVASIFLACFSAAPDRRTQWEQYSAHGAGVCLGLRLVDEPHPDDSRQRYMVPVNYLEAEVRTKVADAFQDTCAAFSAAVNGGVSSSVAEKLCLTCLSVSGA